MLGSTFVPPVHPGVSGTAPKTFCSSAAGEGVPGAAPRRTAASPPARGRGEGETGRRGRWMAMRAPRRSAPNWGCATPRRGLGEPAPRLLLPRPGWKRSIHVCKFAAAGGGAGGPGPLHPSPRRLEHPAAAPLRALHGGAGGRAVAAAAGPRLRGAAAAAGAAGELGGLPGAAGARRRAPVGRRRHQRGAALRARELPAGRAARGLRALPLPRSLPRRRPLRLQVWLAPASGLGL